MGFAYRTATAMVAQGVDIGDVLSKLSALDKTAPGSVTAEAVLGLADEPKLTVKQAFDVYVKEIMPAELVGKSEAQRADWKKVKLRAVSNFVA